LRRAVVAQVDVVADHWTLALLDHQPATTTCSTRILGGRGSPCAVAVNHLMFQSFTCWADITRALTSKAWHLFSITIINGALSPRRTYRTRHAISLL
jgi:hypothetical protein